MAPVSSSKKELREIFALLILLRSICQFVFHRTPWFILEYSSTLEETSFKWKVNIIYIAIRKGF